MNAAAVPPATGLIRALRDADWFDVRRIYALGIETRNATFETEVAPEGVFGANWIADQRWVIELSGNVVGWASLVPFSHRHCYRGVAECSIYIDPAASGRGLGRALLAHQVAESDRAGYWTLQAAIFPENEASLHLHHQAGFREVGRRERIGQLDGIWRDTVLLERRTG